jgi:hypothetical protein
LAAATAAKEAHPAPPRGIPRRIDGPPVNVTLLRISPPLGEILRTFRGTDACP